MKFFATVNKVVTLLSASVFVIFCVLCVIVVFESRASINKTAFLLIAIGVYFIIKYVLDLVVLSKEDRKNREFRKNYHNTERLDYRDLLSELKGFRDSVTCCLFGVGIVIFFVILNRFTLDHAYPSMMSVSICALILISYYVFKFIYLTRKLERIRDYKKDE